jgi:hypothetical protein
VKNTALVHPRPTGHPDHRIVVGIVVLVLIVAVGLLIGYGWISDRPASTATHDEG